VTPKYDSDPTDMSNTNRPYDIVVWGATGFTGKLVSEYLTEQYTGYDFTGTWWAKCRSS
jgi:hypothetical protein